jgi:hypothetical protein
MGGAMLGAGGGVSVQAVKKVRAKAMALAE